MNNPKLLLRLGMTFLILALLSQRFLHPAGINENLLDGAKGVLFGVAIALNLLFVYRNGGAKSQCR
jgi:hypothetical protein